MLNFIIFGFFPTEDRQIELVAFQKNEYAELPIARDATNL